MQMKGTDRSHRRHQGDDYAGRYFAYDKKASLMISFGKGWYRGVSNNIRTMRRYTCSCHHRKRKRIEELFFVFEQIKREWY